jgi:hypothetical protein
LHQIRSAWLTAIRWDGPLDPDQPGGSQIALPPDDELKADLASAQWELTDAPRRF